MDHYRHLYDYTTTLSFWRLLEDKYRDRKAKWLNLNTRAVPAKRGQVFHGIIKTSIKLDDEIAGKDTKEPESTSSRSSSEDNFMDAKMEKEFSDVDSEYFLDPGERRRRYIIR